MTNADIIKKLIGDIQPYGSEHIDEKRFENLQQMCDLVENLLIEIKVASEGRKRQEYSMQKIGQYAHTFLQDIAAHITTTNEEKQ